MPLKERVNKRGHGTCFGKDDQAAEQKERHQYGKQPIALPKPQEFPELGDNRFVSHTVLSQYLLANRSLAWVGSLLGTQ